MDPKELLLAGCEIIDPALVPYGFRFRLDSVGKGSGGRFATGTYTRSDRSLELHFRYALGLVSYAHGSMRAPHEALIRGVGAYGRHAYPGFSDDPLDGFRHLRADLERYLNAFVQGSDEEVIAMLSRAAKMELERPKGLAGLP